MVYYAVLPAEIMPRFPKSSPERAMRGGLPHKGHVHHVMIALFERTSSQRVSEANVTATVNEVGLGPVTKTLEPFAVDDAVTYGNYFAKPGKALYQVAVTIRRPGDVGPVTLRFEYRHHRSSSPTTIIRPSRTQTPSGGGPKG